VRQVGVGLYDDVAALAAVAAVRAAAGHELLAAEGYDTGAASPERTFILPYPAYENLVVLDI